MFTAAPLHTLLLIGPLGPWEVGIILVLGVLIFGKRLPEVGRNIGKSFVEFKKGLAGATEEINKAKHEADRLSHEADRSIDTTNQHEAEPKPETKSDSDNKSAD